MWFFKFSYIKYICRFNAKEANAIREERDNPFSGLFRTFYKKPNKIYPHHRDRQTDR